MGNAVVVEDRIDAEWWRRIHVMANAEGDLASVRDGVPVDGPNVTMRVQHDGGCWHLRAWWPVRGQINLQTPVGVWPMVGWFVGHDSRVSQAIFDAGVAFALAFDRHPMYAFVQEIPARVEEFMDVYGLCLVRGEWVPAGFVAAACGAMQEILPVYKQWKRVGGQDG